MIAYMPNGQPAPALLTAEELATFLRLENDRPDFTIKRLREAGKIHGIQISRGIVYPLAEALKFIDRELAEDPR